MTKPGLEEIENALDPELYVPEDVEPSITDILPRGYLSVSQMVTFLKCPYSWYLRYVEERVPVTSARMFQGIQVHQAVERVLEERLYTGALPPLALATDTFSDAFESQRPLIADWEGVEPGAVKDLGVQCCKVFHEEAAPKAMPIVVEKTFSTVIKSPDGKISLPVLGRIDSLQVQANGEKDYQTIREKVAPMVQQQKLAMTQKKRGARMETPKVAKPLRIHDLKVVTDKWSESDLANDLQFMLYSGVEHIPDVQVDQLVKGRAKIPRPRYEVLPGVMTNAQVQHGVRVAQGVAKSIAMGHFPLTDPSNWWCTDKWCSMWKYCRGCK